MALLSANVIACETVLFEKNDVPSAVRIMSVLTLPPGRTDAHFFSVTFLHCQPGDHIPHKLRIHVARSDGSLVADAPEHPFLYGYRVDPRGPGAYILTTEFNIDVTRLAMPCDCLIIASLDGNAVARAPVMLRQQ